MTLRLLPDSFAVCKIESLDGIDWQAPYVFMAKTDDELSLVCPAGYVPAGALAVEEGWRALRVCGTLDFGLVGIIAHIAGALAARSIALFVVSTYDTDYVLVKEDKLTEAICCLREEGYTIDD